MIFVGLQWGDFLRDLFWGDFFFVLEIVFGGIGI
jgi:hypothetical protein